MYLYTRIFPTTCYARVLLFMFIRRELGGTGTGCLFQFTYCEYTLWSCKKVYDAFHNILFDLVLNCKEIEVYSMGTKSAHVVAN